MVSIKSIFFDLFGVLIGIDQSATIHHISKKVNLPYLETKDIVMGEIFMRLERGEIQFKQYFQDLQYALPNGDNLKYDEFKTIWTTNKIDELPAVQLLSTLKETYSLYIISNTSESHIAQLKAKFTLFSNFEYIITSEAAKSSKPSIEIFNYALNKTGAVAESSVFIDDLASNVSIAKTIGFKAHHYKDYEGFDRFISSF
jgi:putative hydrolase of the HAD superfamily